MNFIASPAPQTQDTDPFEVVNPQQFYQDLSKLAPGDVNQPLYLPFDINGLAAGSVTTFNTDAGIPDYWYVTLRPVGNSKVSVFVGPQVGGVPIRIGGGGHVKVPGLSESLTIFVEAGSAPIIGTVFAVRGYSVLDLAGGDIGEGSSAFGPNGQQLVIPSLYNNVSYEAQRSNYEGVLFASAARTTTVVSASQINVNARGLILYLNITAASGTGGLKMRLGTVDPVSGAVRLLTQDGSFRLTTGLFILSFGPAANAFVDAAQAGVLPRTWYADIAVGDASSYTYSLAYSYAQ